METHLARRRAVGYALWMMVRVVVASVVACIACVACSARRSSPPAEQPRTVVAADPSREPPRELARESSREPEPAPTPEPAPDPEPPACPAAARDAYQKPDKIVALLALEPGMTVVDLGSGDGYFLCHLSRAVGPRGKVIATEVGKKLVAALEKRVEKSGLVNVDVVLAPKTDVGASGADRILIVNVWHHIAKRRQYAAKLAKALTTNGRIVIVDFPFNKKSGHGVGHKQVLADLAAGGFDASLVEDDLPKQYVITARLR